MATAEELLSTSYEPHFYISEDLRTISIPIGQYVIGVYSDENVRRIWFDMPSTCDGTDLSDFEITINYRNAIGDVGRYYVTDAIVDNSTITFSWLVSRSVCVSEGTVLFNVCLRLFDSDNETILKEFNTTLAEMRVLRGLEANLEITTPQQDAINSVVGPAVEAATAANEAKVRANEAATEASSAAESVTEALSLLDSTTERAEAAIEAIGDISELAVPLMSETTRGGATLGSGLTVDGGALSIGDVVTDETNGAIYSVDAKGWAEQDGTPTPDNPVPIQVLKGRNLLPNSMATQTVSGVTLTVNADKSITANGTASDAIDLEIGTVELLGGSYVLGGCPSDGAWSKFCLQLTDNPRTTNKGIDTGSGIAVTLDAGGYAVRLHVTSGQNVSGLTFKPQLELGSNPTPYVPYGHVGLEVQGRNLATFSDLSSNTDGGLNTQSTDKTFLIDAGKTYTLSFERAQDGIIGLYIVYEGETKATRITYLQGSNSTYTFTLKRNGIMHFYATASTFTANAKVIDHIQLEPGDTAHEYEPYHHETRAIPLPLKSDGERWAGGLPDGTADKLAIDSAGRYEWGVPVGVVDLGSLTWNYVSGGPYYYAIVSGKKTGAFNILSEPFATASRAGAANLQNGEIVGANGDTAVYAKNTSYSDAASFTTSLSGKMLYYQLATPTTEHAYIDLPTIPEGATVDIPELREVGVRCFVHGVSELVDHANNWGARCKQNESRIAALEAAIANLATTEEGTNND